MIKNKSWELAPVIQTASGYETETEVFPRRRLGTSWPEICGEAAERTGEILLQNKQRAGLSPKSCPMASTRVLWARMCVWVPMPPQLESTEGLTAVWSRLPVLPGVKSVTLILSVTLLIVSTF